MTADTPNLDSLLSERSHAYRSLLKGKPKKFAGKIINVTPNYRRKVKK